MRKPDPIPATTRWLLPAALVLTAVFLLGLFSTEMSDPDAWWHLATGRYIVQHHRLPTPDPFAYTTAKAAPASPDEARTRQFNLTHEWLAQAAWYGVYRAGGFAAVVLWKAVLLALLCGLTGWVAARRAQSGWWGIAAALAAASLAIEFAHDRPALLTYVFTAAFLAILESRRRLYLLPLLALIWANCHGGFFLGWIVCGAYAIDAIARRAPDWRKVFAAGAAAVLASGFNPNGFAVLATVLQYRQSPLQATLIEWSRADLWGPPYAFDLLLYGAALALALAWRRVRLSDWLLFAAFAAAALMAFRNEMLIGLLAPVLIASYAPRERLKAMAARFRPRAGYIRPLRALPYAALAALMATTAWGAARGSFFQLRAAEWSYPAGAAAFLLQHRIARPAVQHLRVRRLSDLARTSRSSSTAARSAKRCSRITARSSARRPTTRLRDRVLAQYGVGAIVVNAFEYNCGTLYPLVLALADWKLVYEDPQALVFVRDLPPGMIALDASRLYDHLDAECRLHVEHDPDLAGMRAHAGRLLPAARRSRSRAPRAGVIPGASLPRRSRSPCSLYKAARPITAAT